MATAYRSLLIVLLLCYVAAALSAPRLLGFGAALGGHQTVALAVAIVGALIHSLPLSYFMGSGYWIKYHAESSGAGPEWKQRHSQWLRSRGYPVIYLAGLSIVATGVAGGLADTLRLAPHWHGLLALAAMAFCLLELLWVPPLMQRNRELLVELASTHKIPKPGTAAAEQLAVDHAAESVPPLIQCSRILIYGACNVLGLWFWLRFGTEGWRDVPLLPFGALFVGTLTVGLGIYWRHRPQGPRSAKSAWIMACATAAALGGVLAALPF